MMSKFVDWIRPTTLQRKTTFFILLPTFAILASIGFIGNILVRDALLVQWQQTAIARLQRSAHVVDMRLMRPRELLQRLQLSPNDNNGQDHELQRTLDQLRHQDGVIEVKTEWYDQQVPDISKKIVTTPSTVENDNSLIAHLAITPPVLNETNTRETVSLTATFTHNGGRPIGHIEVIISFYDLIDQIVKAPWWHGSQVALVDVAGHILVRTPGIDHSVSPSTNQQFGIDDPFEKATLNAMRDTTYGTVFDNGSMPDRISGYYRLSEAPWTLVVISKGDKALQPVTTFRSYIYIIGIMGILVALLYLRLVISTITRSVKNVSEAAKRLTQGETCTPLPIVSHDEVGELTRCFNTMATQLEERLHLQEEMNMAREVQQNLLPQTSFSDENLDIAGLSSYCQHTGGDYFDLLPAIDRQGVVTVIVGDVVGHGIGAALMMASIRAMIRCRSIMPGNPVDIITDVNRLLCRDTCRTGNFSTLFYLTIDRTNSLLHWIRCGHDPAIVYSVTRNVFSELRGEGLVLGFDEQWQYEENNLPFYDQRQIILIGSDGIWEAENGTGNKFGKERVKEIISAFHHLTAEMLVLRIMDELREFLQGRPQHDDATMMIIKTW